MTNIKKPRPDTLLKTNFEVSSKIDAFYTGGKVQFSSEEDHLLCTCNDKIQVIHVKSGKVVQTLQEEGDVVSCFALSPDDKFCVTASKSLLLRQWDWMNGTQIRTWKAVHRAPIASMTFDSTSTLLATGSSDSTVKVWDIIKQYYTHNFKGSSGVVSLVCFHPNAQLLHLFSASDDCKIRIWDLKTSRCLAVLESHYSVVTSLAFSHCGQYVVSSSRDNVLNMWNLSNKKLLRTVPAFEGVESVVMLPIGIDCPGCDDKSIEYFITAGSKGQLRVWKFSDGKCVFSKTVLHAKNNKNKESSKDESGQQIVHATLCRTLGMIAVVTFDHNIVLHELASLTRTKQFVGYNDEILDLSFVGADENHLAVATNSSQLRIYDLTTMNCQLLEGHTDTILSLEVNNNGNRLVTGSKDNTIRIWKMTSETEFKCVAVGVGHTHAVATVAWSRLNSSFVASGSQDNTIKIWNVPSVVDNDVPVKMTVKFTEKAHDRDINSITVSPNDKLLATGSQDKTARIWVIASGSSLGTLRGHKKGVWCVKFSPVDQCLATSSADSTIKIWALSDLTCVKTFEGHTSSVLRICFITRGMQLISSGSEGLLKLWTIKTNECIKTFDQHLDKVWSIAVNKSQDQIVSGGADSVINVWKDVSETEKEEAQAALEENVLKQQELSNLISSKKYLEAIALAITLNQPFRVLSIIKDVLLVQNGLEELTKAVTSFREDQLDVILRFLVEWNTNSKNCHVAQTVLSIILKNKTPYELMNRPNMKETVEALIPYSEKHFQRMNRLLQQMEFIEYTWQSMKLSAPLTSLPQSIGEPSQAVSTSSGAEDCRLTRSTDNSPEDHQTSENIDLPSSPVEVNYTNGRHTEETSEEEEEMNREHMADVEGETEIRVMTKRKKTKKLHEEVPQERKKAKHKIQQKKTKTMKTESKKEQHKKKRKTKTA
ncbi:transducin beta-like protein 3 isoform X1 [Porites lutea]|uniref:transducin beta-like protein 3 isoform X1 n=1 Tax=Porites lutea TaxID=51062 RepID=UPI003CC6B3CF